METYEDRDARRLTIVLLSVVGFAFLPSAGQADEPAQAPEERLKVLQLEVRNASSVETKFRFHIQHQKPFLVHAAWSDPTFLFLDEAARELSPRNILLLRDHKLSVFEKEQTRPGFGIQITNYARLVDHDTKAEFKQAVELSEHFTQAGSLGLKLLKLLELAPLDEATLTKSGDRLQFTIDGDDFTPAASVAEFAPADGSHFQVRFDIPADPKLKPALLGVDVVYAGVPEEGNTFIEIDSLELNWEVDKIAVPEVIGEKLTPVMVERLEEIDDRLMYLLRKEAYDEHGRQN